MNLKVILLAGGYSTRFWPLSDKNLFSFLGKPLIEHKLNDLTKAGFDNIVIVVNEKNKDLIASYHSSLVVQEKEGIGGAVYTGIKNTDGAVLVINADDLFPLSFLIKVKNFIEKEKPENFLTAVKVEKYFPGGYLVMDNNKILGIIEKPGPEKMPSPYFRFVMDYFQNGKKLKNELEKLKNSEDYELAITNLIKKKEKFELLEYNGVWCSLKYPWHVLDASNFFLKTLTQSKISKNSFISENSFINGPVIIEEGVKIYENTKIIGPCFIGKNVIIGNHCLIRESIIEEGCVLGFSTEITRSYIGKNCWFHRNYIGDSILSNNISLGAGATLANLRLDEQEIYSYIKKIKINTQKLKLGSIIGDNVRIGINTSLMPGIKIGSNTFIGAGLTLDKDILENKFVKGKTKIIITDNKRKTNKDRKEFRDKINRYNR